MAASTEDLATEAQQHRAAGEAAEVATLWQDAVGEYEQCLSLIVQAPDVAGQDEAELLTALGRCYWNLSEARTAWRTLRRAISLYSERDDGIGKAHATVEILRIWGPPDRHKTMCDDALASLPADEHYLRARLYLSLRWSDDDEENYNKALAIADEHGFEDILASRKDREAWHAVGEGRIEDGIAALLEAHETYARLGIHDAAAGVIRGAAFGIMETGFITEGYALAERSFAYASKVHLQFSAELALMDLVGVHFARDEFDRCRELLAGMGYGADFRGDLFSMWMAEEEGDVDRALSLMVNPDRGGNTATAVGQIHAASAGLLYRTGKKDAAGQALRAWQDVHRPGRDDLWIEAAAFTECLFDLGDDDLIRTVYDSFENGQRQERYKLPPLYSTLQGRTFGPLRGGICLRLGLLDEAERHYREGLAFSERERFARDAAACRAGLDDVASRRD